MTRILLVIRKFNSEQVIMGACVSTPSKNIKSRKKHHHRFRKRHGKFSKKFPDGTKKRKSDAGNRLTDYALSEFVHMDFEKGATTTCRRSEVSNSTFHLTQLQWHHSQYDTNGMSFHTFSRGCTEESLFPWILISDCTVGCS